MRTPTKIKPFYYVEGFSKDKFLQVLDSYIKKALNLIDKPGILLSGGIDSSLLAIMAIKHHPGIPFLVVADDINHVDVQAAKRLAKEMNLNLWVHIFKSKEILDIQRKLRKRGGTIYPGDDCVFGALKLAAPLVTGIIATDGIDELMGGYWGHRDRKRFPDIKDAFKYFWDELEEKHLTPMYRSAKAHKLDIVFIYLFPQIIEYLSEIPFEERIKGNVGKAVWREIAQIAGVPSWIIERPKEGFVNAFD